MVRKPTVQVGIQQPGGRKDPGEAEKFSTYKFNIDRVLDIFINKNQISPRFPMAFQSVHNLYQGTVLFSFIDKNKAYNQVTGCLGGEGLKGTTNYEMDAKLRAVGLSDTFVDVSRLNANDEQLIDVVTSGKKSTLINYTKKTFEKGDVIIIRYPPLKDKTNFDLSKYHDIKNTFADGGIPILLDTLEDYKQELKKQEIIDKGKMAKNGKVIIDNIGDTYNALFKHISDINNPVSTQDKINLLYYYKVEKWHRVSNGNNIDDLQKSIDYLKTMVSTKRSYQNQILGRMVERAEPKKYMNLKLAEHLI